MTSRFKKTTFQKQEEGILNSQNVLITLLKQARKSGILNLSNRSLGKVPDSIWLLHQEIPGGGKSLSMDDSGDSWWDQVDLTKLILASNNLSELSENISNFPALVHLDLHDNQLESLPAAVGGLIELVRLNISQNSFKAFPSCITLLKNLRCLYIQSNDIENLPESLGDLCLLEELDVSRNKINNLPSSIKNLTKITVLTASQNLLKVITPEIGCLRALKSLDLRENKIHQLPDEIGELKQLDILYLQMNCLSKFPSLKCSNLKELYLGKNCIKDVTGSDIQPLISLVTLDLRDNRIRNLPEEISSAHSLERLDLTNNDLSNIPNALGVMENLKALSIEGNHIRNIRRDIIAKGTLEIKKYLMTRITSDELSSLPSITTTSSSATSARGGGIASPDNTIFDEATLKCTKSLNLSDKKLPQSPGDLFSMAERCGVTKVNCSKNTLTSIPQGLLALSSSLVELDLSFNRIESLPSDIGQLNRLMFLSLSNNLLTSLPNELKNLKSLREINLSMNRFVKLPEALYELMELETILIADNKVETFDATRLCGLSKLSTLDLQNNNISFLDPLLGNCTQLKHCKLEGNQFRNPRSAILIKGTGAILEYLRDRIVS